MGGSLEGRKNIEHWIRIASNLTGKNAERLTYSTFRLGSHPVNIKYRQFDNKGWYWHSVTRPNLNRNDVFVFICGNYKTFCIFPKKVLKKLFVNTKSRQLHCHINHAEGKIWTKSLTSTIEDSFIDNWNVVNISGKSRWLRIVTSTGKSKGPPKGIISLLESSAKKRERIRQYITKREEQFRRNILTLYQYKCAFCGIQCGIVQAAHILPVAYDGKEETVNGIALCPNHHKAFDMGLLNLDYENDCFRIEVDHTQLKQLKYRNKIRELQTLNGRLVSIPLKGVYRERIIENTNARRKINEKAVLV